MATRSKRKRRRREAIVRPPAAGPEDDPGGGGDQAEDAGRQRARVAGPQTISRRQKLISVGIAGLLLASLVVGIVVFARDGTGSPGVEVADGTVVDADQDSLLFRPSEPIEGNAEIELAVRPEDRGEKLDPEHLLYHASTGGAMRIYYERDGDEYIAREAYDLPGLP
jgi:hypothetical protein